MNGKVAHIPAMFQKALSAANSRPCSRPKKTSETTASWGREAARPPIRGPKRSATAVTAMTSPADTTIFRRAASLTRETIDEDEDAAGLGLDQRACARAFQAVRSIAYHTTGTSGLIQ